MAYAQKLHGTVGEAIEAGSQEQAGRSILSIAKEPRQLSCDKPLEYAEMDVWQQRRTDL